MSFTLERQAINIFKETNKSYDKAHLSDWSAEAFFLADELLLLKMLSLCTSSALPCAVADKRKLRLDILGESNTGSKL